MSNFKVLALALVITALLCMPALAYEQAVQVQSPTGGITPSFSMSIVSGVTIIPLAIGTINQDGPLCNVSTNTPYTIKAKDSMALAKPASTGGKMAHYSSASTWVGTGLTNALKLAVNGGAYLPMSGTDTVVRTGTAEAFSSPLKFQQVIVVSDPVLPTDGSKYYIELLVSGAANP